jgi:hypothetical protein
MYFFAVIVSINGSHGTTALINSLRTVKGMWFPACGMIFATSAISQTAGLIADFIFGMVILIFAPSNNILISKPVMIASGVLTGTIGAFFSLWLTVWFLNRYLLINKGGKDYYA